MAGQSFQQWLALTQAARQLPKGNSLDVDVSIPNVVKLDVGTIGLEHRSGSGVSGTDVPVVAVLSLPPSVDSQVLESSGGADGQSGTRSSPCQ